MLGVKRYELFRGEEEREVTKEGEWTSLPSVSQSLKSERYI